MTSGKAGALSILQAGRRSPPILTTRLRPNNSMEPTRPAGG